MGVLVENENRYYCTDMASIDKQVESRLTDRGIRYTGGRREVVAALAVAGGPRSAGELLDDLDGRVPLSSLYRSLAVLEDAGIVIPHLGIRGLTRYELGEWLSGHHHHLVCIDCGTVEDLEVPPAIESEVEALVASLGAGRGFRPTGHALEIEGHCERCA
jgi:Fur family ferric uptake transcriptional regulator